jgi:hypothetical protein
LEPLCDNHLRLSVILKTLMEFVELGVGKDGNHWERGPGCKVDD